jgi:hypothetical protein
MLLSIGSWNRKKKLYETDMLVNLTPTEKRGGKNLNKKLKQRICKENRKIKIFMKIWSKR